MKNMNKLKKLLATCMAALVVVGAAGGITYASNAAPETETEQSEKEVEKPETKEEALAPGQSKTGSELGDKLNTGNVKIDVETKTDPAGTVTDDAKAEDKAGDIAATRETVYSTDDISYMNGLKKPADKMLKELSDYYPQIGTIFQSYDITTYDFSAPYDADDGILKYDVYTSNNQLYYLEVTFEAGKVTTIYFYED